MTARKKLIFICSAAVICTLIVWFSPATGGKEKVYEIRPEVTLPEYRTDAARAIDAYERLMERYMNLTAGNFTRLGSDSRAILSKLDAVEAKLDELSERIARIETELGIEEPKPTDSDVGQEPGDNDSDKIQ